jgi:hypothetical protein
VSWEYPTLALVNRVDRRERVLLWPKARRRFAQQRSGPARFGNVSATGWHIRQ